VEVQGGIGTKLFGIFDAGLVGYALGQVTDDSGSDLPAVVRGARDRVFGLGPEIEVEIAAIRTQLTVRYEHDLAVASRPEGQIFVLELNAIAWSPEPPKR
jgi:hypothetical protein